MSPTKVPTSTSRTSAPPWSSSRKSTPCASPPPTQMTAIVPARTGKTRPPSRPGRSLRGQAAPKATPPRAPALLAPTGRPRPQGPPPGSRRDPGGLRVGQEAHRLPGRQPRPRRRGAQPAPRRRRSQPPPRLPAPGRPPRSGPEGRLAGPFRGVTWHRRAPGHSAESRRRPATARPAGAPRERSQRTYARAHRARSDARDGAPGRESERCARRSSSSGWPPTRSMVTSRAAAT